ncbi:hypothetical protein MLD38_012820 [Melastoma candidum]|uniref:Uncharacterized protein n=1 Tax=Melastoma candidum TaxID=119954 RepID=A0ACB9R7T6_9MYRT|nr:hypothetical protein MLD38_012820 [Melastoma candidum]
MQGGSYGIGYGLKYQARCISDVKADTDHTSFLAGTLSLKEENELVCEGIFSYPDEIWDLRSCPFDLLICSSVFSSGESGGAAVWRIPELVLWWPSGKQDKIVSIDEENIFLWTLDCPREAAQVQSQESVGMLQNLSSGAWDPHDVNAVAATSASSVQFWDVRTMKKSSSIDSVHARDLDYDIQKQHLLVTVEDEGGICIWDLRKLKAPIQELPGHTHWTCTVRCNPEYDGLILSAGTDSVVNLWFSSSLCRDDLASERISNSYAKQTNPLLCTYSDYEDSVYGLAWSTREPWFFASLSYDGRL